MSDFTIEKSISPNDCGANGAHQAGMLVPKEEGILSFFPALDPGIKNPRCLLHILDENDCEWTFNFIYYNNRFFGGTRNEYRLTGMTVFFREWDINAGDTLLFSKKGPRTIRIKVNHQRVQSNVLKLSGTWRIVKARF
jgi:hypothetical protein